jgi:hypothetical protein
MGKTRSIALHICVAATFSLLLIWGNTLYRQWYQYSLGEDARSKGELIAAISAYEASIHMYTPLGPFVGRSADRLWQMGQDLEKSGDSRRALVAYRALRSSFYAVRSLFAPGTDWIDRCDTRIALLVKTQAGGK